MTECVRFEYTWDGEDRPYYTELLRKLQQEPTLGVNYGFISERCLDIVIEGPEESLRTALDDFFVNSKKDPVKVKVDKHFYLCDVLSHVSSFFRASTKRGFAITLESLEKQGAKRKGRFEDINGFFGSTIVEF